MKNNMLVVFLMWILSSVPSFADSCSENKYKILIGYKSSPSYEEIKVGSNFNESNSLSVYGFGELGRQQYGEIRFKKEEKNESCFKSGGIVINTDYIDFVINYKLNVDLCLYLIKKDVDGKIGWTLVRKEILKKGQGSIILGK